MVSSSDIARLRRVSTRSISAENPDGSKAGGARTTTGTGAQAARDLGLGWKVSPSVQIPGGTTHPLATIDQPGTITHIWLTTHRDHWRSLILRAYWDGEDVPAIEVPIGDFFASGWCEFAQVSSEMIAANPNGGFNSYWPMPFRRSARLTVENLGDADATSTTRSPTRSTGTSPTPATCTPGSGAATRWSRGRCTRSSTGSRDTGTTWVPTWPGPPTVPAGGAKVS